MSQLTRWCVGVILALGLTSAKAADFFFKDGDVVVMIGDSITEQHLYSNFVEMWTVTRFPKWKLTFRNVGIGGDTSGGGNSRFVRDVLIHKPTAMTVDFGMNDGRYKAFEDATFKPYMEGLRGMAKQAQSASIRTAWVTPQPLDAGDQGPTALVGYNQTLEQFSDGVKKVADENQGLFVDQFHPYLAALDRARSKSSTYARITAGDAVHPGPPGQALMAASILKGLSFPSLVSSAEIDATGKKVSASKNCEITNLAAKDGGLSFSRLDAALPFFPTDAWSILAWAPILEELNNYHLKITGLSAGKYDVQIEGKSIVVLTSEQLAAGANIAVAALEKGAIADQVKAVREAVEKKNRFHHDTIFRGIVLAGIPKWVDEIVPRQEFETKKQAIINAELAKLPALDADVASTLVMKAIRFDIVPVK